MVQLKLEGFRVFIYGKASYLLPVYSDTCYCGIKKYLLYCVKTKIFKPKYFKKYMKLRAENVDCRVNIDMMPHVVITFGDQCSIHHDFKIEGDDLTYPYYGNGLMEFGKKCYEFWKQSENFCVGNWLERYYVNYWADSLYGWYVDSPPRFDRGVEEKRKFLLQTGLTKLLETVEKDFEKFRLEVRGSLNLIQPVIDIVCEYGLEPIHVFCLVLRKFKRDIEVYMES
ncbi:MAG: hypothetical protein Harvfovirus6_45 [Harvfovirus sp.]|uniref:Uncharacterized protein n=1 Tax=Harvfovirus sp. TaxID=2487768 RepID=A0A3G5A0S7_9VIRU|nr:MAG: hypothetical protein Harvfovirus6_45 [Harvfovirus sp.]